MATLITDQYFEERALAERQAAGGDRYDEVWNGVYYMNPLANNEHQEIVGDLYFAIKLVAAAIPGARVLPGANVSDRESNWKQNYRVPDVVACFPGSRAQDRGTHWFGGPDFVVEVASSDDHSREKLEFYSSIGVRELLIVDRDPWLLELLRLQNSELQSMCVATCENEVVLTSEVLPLSFRLVAGETRPRIEASELGGARQWTI